MSFPWPQGPLEMWRRSVNASVAGQDSGVKVLVSGSVDAAKARQPGDHPFPREVGNVSAAPLAARPDK